MESLPSDIIQDIVSRVPAESVLECKFVCKNWETLIRASNFSNMHIKRQLNQLHGGDNGNDNLATKVESCLFFACHIEDPVEYITLLYHGGQPSDKISIDEKYIYSQNLKRIYHPPLHDDSLSRHLVGSCNGLVCAFRIHQNIILDPIYICNPLTREYVYLPKLVVKKEDVPPGHIRDGEVDLFGNIACGFGYVRSTNEYKVVRIHYLKYREGNVEVYTLGSGCGWRAIRKVSYRLDTWTTGTYSNDAIYWTAQKKVVVFDLAKEDFRSLSVPLSMENRRQKDICGLVALGRQLCLYVDDRFRVEIWSLMESSNSKETWCMEFDIYYYEASVRSRDLKLQPILLTTNGQIILLYDESVLYCYDTKTTILKMISDEASTDYIKDVEAIAHVNTFVSLEAMGEPSKRYTVRPRRARTPWDDVIDELDRVSFGEELDTTRYRLR